MNEKPVLDVVKVNDFVYKIEPTGKMNVPVKIFADENLVKKMQQDSSLQQACNVASMPGIVGESIVMSDAHQGYGYCIGGVAAFDMEEGIISPGGIGFDQNCGVRLLTTNLTKEQVEGKKSELLEKIYKACPVGVGVDGVRITPDEMKEVMVQGAKWAVANGYGSKDDLEHCEAGGCLPEADPKHVPDRALHRGKRQLGTVGAGNHFVELQVVDEVYSEVAEKFGLQKGNVVVMIHCGSRGFGHQVCSDYIRMIEDAYPNIVASLPDKNLIYAPLKSELAKKFWGAMNAAANFAFCNRHILGHNVRQAFIELFPDCSVETVYDVCHNIAKRETHVVNGEQKELMVHRKGATRAFPAGSEDIPEAYRAIGQPVLIPGSMGTSSWVLVGEKGSLEQSFGSTAHGAGRMMSRMKAKKDFPADDVRADLAKKGIQIKAATLKGISEEAPGAYKDVDEVIAVSDSAGIARKVARLVPIGVIKG
ncbi:MAG: RtcB family protein [Candidatus Woesearchaeota archaeon]|nr:RtcB family protein [Candidatus Woesearchaeota archaeon]